MSDRRRIFATVAGAVGVLLFVAGLLTSFDTTPEFSSVEIAFAEQSPSGLAIVPASCPSVPSNPDFPHNTCSGACPNGLSISVYPSCACPSNMQVTGAACACPAGTAWDGTQCSPYSCPAGQYWLGTHCGCPVNTSWNGSQCISACPSNQILSGSQCVCPSGTSWNGSQCTATSCPGGQVWSGTNCSCPSGTAWNGSQCVSSTCPSGQTWDGAGCVCPAGTQWDGSLCIATVCPAGYAWNGTSCVAQCILHYYCAGVDRNGDGVGDDRWIQNAQCQDSLDRQCAWGCFNGQCLLAPQGFLDIRVTPQLVRRSSLTTVNWQANNVASCTVSENNPLITDSWLGETLGCVGNTCSGSHESSMITQQTRYTLNCIGLDGNEYSDTAVVNILPVFIEL